MGAVIILDGGSCQGEQMMHWFECFIPVVQRNKKDFKREKRKGDPELQMRSIRERRNDIQHQTSL